MRRTRRIGSVALVLTCALALAGCDWAQVGFDPAGTASNPVEPALTASSVAHLHSAWSRLCACQKPLVVGNTVYVLDSPLGPGPESIRAIDAATGTVRWSTVVGVASTSTGSVSANLDAVANGLVYARLQPRNAFGQFSASGRLIALDASTGAPRWSLVPPAPGSGIAVSGPNVVVDGPLAFVTADAGGSAELSAVDTSGHVRWSETPGGLGGALAADAGRTIFMETGVLITKNGRNAVVPVLTGYDEATGFPSSAVLPALGPVGVARIAFANGNVYGYQQHFEIDGGVGVFAVNPNTGALGWSASDSDLGAVGPRLVGRGVSAPTVIARDPATGTTTWTVTTPSGAVDPVVAAGLVYFGDGNALRIVKLTDGSVAGTFTPFAAEAVAAVTPSNGRVFVATAGHLVAVTP